MKKGFRAVRGAVSLVRLIRDPNRLDQVFALVEALESEELMAEFAAAFARDPRGARALIQRPRIGRVDLKELGALPDGTLGRAYAEHMIANGLDPAAIPTLPSHDLHTFIRAHLYESHDVWHVVTGFKADVAGELGLQAFGLAQFPARVGALLIAGGLVQAVLARFDDCDARMNEIARGWALGKRAQKLFGARWGEMWSVPLADVRRELGIDLGALDLDLPIAVREIPRLVA